MKRIEWIEGRSFTTFPEWVRIFLFTVVVMLLAIILFHASEPKAAAITAAKPEHTFYIIGRDEFTNMENKTVYVLEYSCDGMAQIMPSFQTRAERDKFEVYLLTLGEVKQYEGRK